MGIACHLAVLLGEADGGIHQDQGHTAPLHSGQSADDHVPLQTIGNIAALAQACGIGEDELAVGVVHRGINGVAGGAGLVGHDHPVLTQDAVGQAGFAHVGAADDGHRDAVLFNDRLTEIQVGADGVQQVARAVTVHRRNGHDFVKAQVIELVQLHGGLAHVVALVDRQNDRLMAAAQHVGHILVRRGQAVADIHHHDDAVGGVNGDLGLLPHVGQDALGGLGLNTARVHQHELVAVPLAVGKNAVAVDLPTLGRPTTATIGLLMWFLLFFFSKYAGRCAAELWPPRRRTWAALLP